MSEQKRIYLDNAATSWPKPESVYDAIDQYQRGNGMPIGRSTGQQADELSGMVLRLRQRIQKLVQGTHCHTLFSCNGTDSLNLAIHGTIRAGDHVVTTVAEHNSVLRPLRFLEEKGVLTVTRVECDSIGKIDAQEILSAIRPETRLVAMIHCSNVTGAINDIATVGRSLRDEKTLLLVDAAQSIGCAEIEFDAAGIDLLAAPGHKGLFGPLGTGVLVASKKGQGAMQPFRQGGTGASSDSDRHPLEFPEGYEPGNHNVPGLVGLNAGIEFLEQTGIDEIRSRKSSLASAFMEQLQQIDKVEIIAAATDKSSGIVSFNLPVMASELAVILDSSFGIQIRAGFHCASLIHNRIGCPDGCARVSFSYFNSMDDVQVAAKAIGEIAKAF